VRADVSRVVLAVFAATLVLILLGMVAFGFHAPGWRLVLAALLTASVLAYVVWAARGSGWRLLAAASLLYFALSYLNAMDEGMLFLGLSKQLVLAGLAFGLVSALIVVTVLVALMGKMGKLRSQPAEEKVTPFERSLGQWLWRLAAGDVAYIFLYFAAGTLVFPFVKDFYATMTLPAPSRIILMQVFRALVYMAAALPVARLISDRPHAALALGLALSVLGGIAPLLPDNPLMPGNVRLAHTVEIGVSNFIYGVILAGLFVPRSAAVVPVTAEHAA
jgi:hypothetical protein